MVWYLYPISPQRGEKQKAVVGVGGPRGLKPLYPVGVAKMQHKMQYAWKSRNGIYNILSHKNPL